MVLVLVHVRVRTRVRVLECRYYQVVHYTQYRASLVLVGIAIT
jgi:hypothetical protein